MRKFIKQTIWIVAIVFALFILGWYRSLVDKSDFVHGFDRISVTLVTEGWKVLTNPIVLTGIIIILGLQYIRNYLPNVLPWISEVKFGDLSAKFSAKSLSGDLGGEKVTDSKSHIDDKELTEKIVANLDLDTCWIVLRLADKALTIEEMVEIVGNEFEARREKFAGSKDEYSLFSFGIFTEMNNILRNTLYTFDMIDERKETEQSTETQEKIMLKTTNYAKEQIFKRIQSFNKN